MLLDSLLIDFATRINSRSTQNVTDLGVATAFQAAAALRLLYYYTNIGVPLVVRRLDGLDVGRILTYREISSKPKLFSGVNDRDITNGVNAVDLIKAVAWCKDSQIRAALKRILDRSNDEQIISAVKM
jgi:hypothetical protein